VFVALRLEASAEMFDLAAANICTQSDVEVRIPKIPIVLGDFVFQDDVVTKGIPCQVGEKPVILVAVVTVVRKDQIRLDHSF